MLSRAITQCLANKPFAELEGLNVENGRLTVTTTLASPWNRIVLSLSGAYLTKYPVGEIVFVVEDRIHVLRDNAPHPLEDVLRHLRLILETVDASPAPSSMIDGGTSWVMEPTFEVSPQPLGERLQLDIHQTTAHRCTCEVSDRGRTLDVSIIVHVPMAPVLSDITARGWGLSLKEPLLVILTTHRDTYPLAPFTVEVTQSSPSVNRTLFQLRTVVETFLKNWAQRESLLSLPDGQLRASLVSVGYPLEVIDEVVRTQPDVATSKDALEAAASAAMGLTEPPHHRSLPSRDMGLLVAVHQYVLARLPTLSEYCTICDRPHTVGAASSKMLGGAVCFRTPCAFRSQQLGVGQEAGTTLSLPLTVVDLLCTFLRCAIASARWAKILTPFPALFNPGETEPVTSDSKKDIEVVRAAMSKVPPMQQLVESGFSALSGHPLSEALFHWVVDSNRSLLVPLAEADRLTFMGTTRQFLLVQSSQRHAEAFEKHKAAQGGKSKWAFHGSRPENWHSILRNGLVNASGTPLQVNGTAHGSGVYLSPKGSVSFSYSNLPSGTRKPDMQEEFIDPSTVRCIAICEALEKDIRVSNDIWIQPNAEFVATRFFLVFDRSMSHGYGTDLRDAAHVAKLADLSRRLCH